MTAEAKDAVDESLFSRQIYAIGMDAMKKLKASSVLISGMGGLGAEIAKDLILTGIDNITLLDDKVVEMADVGVNFCVSESDIGKNRAVASHPKLVELNPLLSVSVSTEPLTPKIVSNFKCVVITDPRPQSELFEISDFCHAHNIALLICETRGLFGCMFTDFGECFCVADPTGVPPQKFTIHNIGCGEKTVISVEDESHGLGYMDLVKFHGVEGVSELNGKVFPVTNVLTATRFEIDFDSSKCKYTSENSPGYGEQVIREAKFEFKPFREAIKDPGLTMLLDLCAFGRDQQVTLAFVTAQKQRDSKSTTDFCELAKAVNEELKLVEEVDESLMKEFERESGAVIGGMCAFYGGVASHEVLKAVSQKFTPIQQFLCVGYLPALPTGTIEYQPKGDRYDSYRQVFGNAQQERMEELNYFMIGAGALGCELLKNFALAGFCTKGECVVTDMDSIEKSNLSRQFLFREADIGSMKSEVAAKAAKLMNPSFKVVAHTNRLAQDTRSIYHDDFYEHLDGVCNAVDNMDARHFSDRLCQLYQKPLIDSGTLGPRAHMHVSIPCLTSCFSDVKREGGKGVAVCTIHYYVRNINDAITWTKDRFNHQFTSIPEAVNKFINEPDSFNKDLWTQLADVNHFYSHDKCRTFEDCISWARQLFERYFNFDIRDYTHKYPKDHIDPSTGSPFWNSTHKFPTPASYDPNNQMHATFVRAAAAIWANAQNIEPGDLESVPSSAAKVAIPEWKYCEPTTSDGSDEEVNELVRKLKEHNDGQQLVVQHFEKDDDANHHIDFIWSCANIRAANFEVAPVDRLEAKRIAGDIVPAMETTTAAITGLVTLELYKTHSIVKKPLSDFRAVFLNMSFGAFQFAEAMPCDHITCQMTHKERSQWDRWIVEGDLTVNQFREKLKTDYNCEIMAISEPFSNIMIWSEFSNTSADTKISDIVAQLTGQELSDGQHYIPLQVQSPDDPWDGVSHEIVKFVPNILLKVK